MRMSSWLALIGGVASSTPYSMMSPIRGVHGCIRSQHVASAAVWLSRLTFCYATNESAFVGCAAVNDENRIPLAREKGQPVFTCIMAPLAP